MKNVLLVIAITFLALHSEARGIRKSRPSLTLEKSEIDSNLTRKEAIYRFVFTNVNDSLNTQIIKYSIDKLEGEKTLIDGKYIEIKTTPGKHEFQFFFNENYNEVYSSSLPIKGQHRDEYNVHLQIAGELIICSKPVIYLYPKEDIEVEVKLNIKGSDPFFYPKYTDGWKCKAQPDGTLTIGDNTYNYLFWEALEVNHVMSLDLHEGFVVNSENVIPFLEEKLSLAGLTSKEQADFITFWGPIMAQQEYNFVRFEFNEECDKFAELSITPRPDNIYRIYILTAPVNSDYKVTEQKITRMNRQGFTVLEWGGQQTTIMNPTASINH